MATTTRAAQPGVEPAAHGGSGLTAEAVPPSARLGWALVLTGGSLGIFTAASQTVERIAYLKEPDRVGICEINAVVSCSSVFDRWQSSALGIPNSIIGLAVFSMIAMAGLAGVTGSRASVPFVRVVSGLTVFMAAFVTWYMAQSAFSMRVLCLYCVGCALVTIVAGIGVTRVADAYQALGTGRAGRQLRLMVLGGADVVAWVGLGLVIAAMLYVGLFLL